MDTEVPETGPDTRTSDPKSDVPINEEEAPLKNDAPIEDESTEEGTANVPIENGAQNVPAEKDTSDIPMGGGSPDVTEEAPDATTEERVSNIPVEGGISSDVTAGEGAIDGPIEDGTSDIPNVEDSSTVPIKEEEQTLSETDKGVSGEGLNDKVEKKLFENEKIMPVKEKEVSESKKVAKAPQLTKYDEVIPLFNSKGSLLESESFVRERLQEWKEKRAVIASLITDLQDKFNRFKEIETPTDDDITNLNNYHKNLLEKMSEYEAMTLDVERMMGLAETPLSDADVPALDTGAPEKVYGRESSTVLVSVEEKLPKVIVCETDVGDSIPRIIVCEPLTGDSFFDHKQSDKPERSDREIPLKCEKIVKEKLREEHEILQKLAATNYETKQMSLKLQENLLAKQEMLEKMEHQLLAYKTKHCRILKLHEELHRKLMISSQRFGEGKICKRDLYLKYRGCAPEDT